MDKKWQHIFSQSACPSFEDLELYALGKLAAEKKAQIENHLSECEMCNDELEGYLALGNHNELLTAEKEIASRIDSELFNTKTKKRSLVYFRRIAVAASILVVAGLSVFYLFNERPTPSPVAQKKEKIPMETSKKQDTLLIAQNEPVRKPSQLASKSFEKREVLEDKSESLAVQAEIIESEAKPSYEIVPAPLEYKKTLEKPAQSASPSRSLTVKPDRAQIPLNSGKYLITGKVTDATSGEGLIGVNIMVKGSTTGSVTDQEGRFQIQVPDTQSVLSFSYIGFVPEEVKVNPGQETTIALVEDVKKLDEVVVIGYGTQKKSSETGAVSSITLEKENNYNREEDLQKQIATLKQKLTVTPNDRDIWMKILKKYIQAQDDYHAIEAIDKIKQLSDQSTKLELDEVIQLVNQKSYFKAQRRLRKIK